MKLFRRSALHALAFAIFVTPAAAETTTYVFDKNHTEIRFCWNHFGVSEQCAHFTKFDGELVYDTADATKSTLNVTFQTDSIETLVPLFNEHMRSAKLFDVEKFPEASFKSTKIEKISDKTGKVTGDLTIKGVTKPVTLDVTMAFSGPHPLSKKPTFGFAAKTTLKRSKFNVAYGVPAVSDDIALEIHTEMPEKG